MFMADGYNFSLLWLFPLVMVVLCFLIMRGRKGSMMCGCGSGAENNQPENSHDSAGDILDKRYARGEIDKEEYEQKKRFLNQDNRSLS